MRAQRFRWLFPLLVLGTAAACGSDDEIVDPNGDPPPPVEWMLSGDRTGSSAGDHAVLELYSAGPDSRVDLMLQVPGGSYLSIYSPQGQNTVAKTVYDVDEDEPTLWHAWLQLEAATDTEDFVAVDGNLALETLSENSAEGSFSLDTREVDGDGVIIPDGLAVHVQGRFSARIERTSPGTRAVMKGRAAWQPIAVLGLQH
jgi:hypothetical protein